MKQQKGHIARAAIAGIFILGALSGCASNSDLPQQSRSDKSLLQEAEESGLLLHAKDPEEMVRHYESAIEKEPGNINNHRGLAQSLMRAGRYSDAVRVWEYVLTTPENINNDKTLCLESMVHSAYWQKASELMENIDPFPNTQAALLLAAVVYDHQERWKEADERYAQALDVAASPHVVTNNWGISRMSRGDFKGAAAAFTQALQYSPDFKMAKTNLVISRGMEGIYTLPPIKMNDTEQAEMLHNLGVIAINQGKYDTAEVLLQKALDISPQYYNEAAEKLSYLHSLKSNDGHK